MADGVVVWLTGLPSSGKSTLAARVAAELRAGGVATAELDGDAVRACIVPPHGYGDRGRGDFYATLARLAALLAAQGTVVLVPATATRAAFRDLARSLSPRFVEVFLDVPLDECRRRDAKGLYSAAAPDLPGLTVHYEAPLHPEVTVRDAAASDVARVIRAIDLVRGAELTARETA